jgi:hypothetical protein
VGQIAPDAGRPGLYSTHVGKKYAMAVSGMVLMLFVLARMIGNLKLYLGASSLDSLLSVAAECGRARAAAPDAAVEDGADRADRGRGGPHPRLCGA